MAINACSSRRPAYSGTVSRPFFRRAIAVWAVPEVRAGVIASGRVSRRPGTLGAEVMA